MGTVVAVFLFVVRSSSRRAFCLASDDSRFTPFVALCFAWTNYQCLIMSYLSSRYNLENSVAVPTSSPKG